VTVTTDIHHTVTLSQLTWITYSQCHNWHSSHSDTVTIDMTCVTYWQCHNWHVSQTLSQLTWHESPTHSVTTDMYHMIMLFSSQYFNPVAIVTLIITSQSQLIVCYCDCKWMNEAHGTFKTLFINDYQLAIRVSGQCLLHLLMYQTIGLTGHRTIRLTDEWTRVRGLTQPVIQCITKCNPRLEGGMV